MKRFITILSFVFVLLPTTGCDTPWSAAKRNKEGITWAEWQQGIRTKEEKDASKKDSAAVRQNQLVAEIQEEIDRGNRYIAENPNLSADIVRGIRSGELVRGMNADQVRLLWGKPDSVNKSVGAYGEREQWVYRNSNRRSRYAYLRNGTLDSWQTTE